jgi:hypothetical protein
VAGAGGEFVVRLQRQPTYFSVFNREARPILAEMKSFSNDQPRAGLYSRP